VLLLVEILKALCEVALMSLAGQWLLGVLAGPKRDQNLVYQVFQVVTRPLIRAARLLSPRVVIDRHVPLVAFLLLTFGWLYTVLAKYEICKSIGMQVCRQ
jgi:hypothetical protein